MHELVVRNCGVTSTGRLAFMNCMQVSVVLCRLIREEMIGRGGVVEGEIRIRCSPLSKSGSSPFSKKSDRKSNTP